MYPDNLAHDSRSAGRLVTAGIWVKPRRRPQSWADLFACRFSRAGSRLLAGALWRRGRCSGSNLPCC